MTYEQDFFTEKDKIYVPNNARKIYIGSKLENRIYSNRGRPGLKLTSYACMIEPIMVLVMIK